MGKPRKTKTKKAKSQRIKKPRKMKTCQKNILLLKTTKSKRNTKARKIKNRKIKPKKRKSIKPEKNLKFCRQKQVLLLAQNLPKKENKLKKFLKVWILKPVS